MKADPTDTPKVVTVAHGCWVRVAVDNIAWIDLGEFAVVVDALEQAHLADEVFAAIADTLGDKPIRYLLNTHTHYDHTALNSAFKKRFGTEIVSAATGRLGPNGRWFEGSLRRVQMLHMPGCHTAEDCVVWVPQDKTLFVGDIFGWGLIPLSGRLDADAAKLLMGTYGRLINFDPAVMIPGHGPLGDKQTLERYVRYYHWLVEQCAEAVRAGRKDARILAEIAPPEDMRDWWRFGLWKHEDSLKKVLGAVRRGDLAA